MTSVRERAFVLKVRHHGTPKMVGKIVILPGGQLAFFHEHNANQRHRQTDCPCPVDAHALRYCLLRGIEWVYAYEREAQIMRRIKVSAAIDAATFVYDGRTRHAPAEGSWQKLNVLWRRGMNGGKEYLRAADNTVLISAPFIQERDTVILEDEWE